ncbi:secreted RxLR effector protein 161-like [Lathyrus oleraceus]|uniref:secreted RxLR effector protein 161-like n=1 Tax=Pisum sativum TaxID=3888 RepID=UPI0021D05839|nr:secreted RxLR effector protein 161-like [Pisum sativum]
MSNCNATPTPLETGAKLKKKINDKLASTIFYKQIIGSLMYLCNTKPKICQSIRLLSRFMEKPQECHLTTVKRVLRYIKGALDHGVLMPRKKKSNIDAEVYGYIDSDFSGDHDKNKSIVGYIFKIKGAPISWSSRKQSIATLSSCEAKYVVASYAACQATWIEMLLEELKITEPRKMKLFVDNKLAIDMTNHLVYHGRSKHI